MAVIVIAGGSGFIGNELSKLLSKNHIVRILSRSTSNKQNSYTWNPEKLEYDSQAFTNADIIINLSGSTISKRWTSNYKNEIRNSRIQSVQTIAKAINQESLSIKQFICISATGYYGNSYSKKTFKEDSPAGIDFLAQVCSDWEQECAIIQNKGIPTTILRTGVVIDKNNGALPKIITTRKFGFIGIPGNGSQWFPWIHIKDLTRMFDFIINQKIEGTYNAVNSRKQSIYLFLRLVRKTFKHKPFLIKTPSFILKLLFGEMSTILLTGNKISNSKIKEKGFKFKYSHIKF